MSEEFDPLATSLRALRPTGGPLDRDALMYAAGHASRHPLRIWPVVALVLAVSQAFTIVGWIWTAKSATGLVSETDRVAVTVSESKSPELIATREPDAPRAADMPSSVTRASYEPPPGSLGWWRQQLRQSSELPTSFEPDGEMVPDDDVSRRWWATEIH